ncbi:MAG: type II toxin-antitoxin system RelE/ParE family toxin [Chitinophagales bacterium]
MARSKRLKLIWSEDAVNSSKNIIDWYREELSSRAASKVLSSIKSKAKSIIANPYSFPVCEELKDVEGEFRKVLVGNTFWMIYEIESDRIVILELIHGARDPEIFNELAKKHSM